MTVYVDNFNSRRGRLVFCCHMMADTSAELLAMADRIGVARRWLQCAGTEREHFDLSNAARRRAIAAGAVVVSSRDLVGVIRRKRNSVINDEAK